MSAMKKRQQSRGCWTDARGYPKRAQAKAEHSQEFLRFDRHGDAIDNFMRNFYRQCKEPTRFGFYRVAADMVEALLPVIKDLLKDPVANADLLAPHKVDTSAYQQVAEVKRENAETEAEGQQAAEEVKRENAETETEEQQIQRRRKKKMPGRRLRNSRLRRRRKKKMPGRRLRNSRMRRRRKKKMPKRKRRDSRLRR